MAGEVGRRAEARRRGAPGWGGAGAAGLWSLAAVLAIGAAWLAAAPAAAQPPTRTIALCAACHGSDGRAADPKVPSLAGQPRLFIENQLVLIREGLRDVPIMQEVTKRLTDEEIGELARHYSALPPARAGGAVDERKARAGAAISARALCGTCHLPDYSGQQQVPRLAGQNEAYLLHSLRQFRDDPGPGRDTIMAATLRGMTDDDLANLAHYFAQAGR